jgi:hypothetical protein
MGHSITPDRCFACLVVEPFGSGYSSDRLLHNLSDNRGRAAELRSSEVTASRVSDPRCAAHRERGEARRGDPRCHTATRLDLGENTHAPNSREGFHFRLNPWILAAQVLEVWCGSWSPDRGFGDNDHARDAVGINSKGTRPLSSSRLFANRIRMRSGATTERDCKTKWREVQRQPKAPRARTTPMPRSSRHIAESRRSGSDGGL